MRQSRPARARVRTEPLHIRTCYNGPMHERLRGVEILEPGFSKEAVRKNAELAHDWQWQETASSLYTWTDRFKSRLLDPIARLGRDKMPDAVISFESMDHRILACYALHRNAQGLLDEITMNTKHLSRPMWQVLETLLHEQIHLWQQNFGQHPVTRNYHNREFVDKCEQLGLHPRIGSGAHWKAANGAFAQLMAEHGIPRPTQVIVPKEERRNWWDLGKKERKGGSTLSKWSCGCQNVRVGTKEFHARCTRCGNPFARVEKVAANVARKSPLSTRLVEQCPVEPSARSRRGSQSECSTVDHSMTNH